jgi:hypothetical protein
MREEDLLVQIAPMGGIRRTRDALNASPVQEVRCVGQLVLELPAAPVLINPPMNGDPVKTADPKKKQDQIKGDVPGALEVKLHTENLESPAKTALRWDGTGKAQGL